MKYITLLLVLFMVACANKNYKTTKEYKAEILYQKGTKNLISKNYTLALKSLLQAVKYDPKNSGIHNNLGMAYYFKKNTSKAKAHILRALELNRGNTDARSNLANIYMEDGKFDLAMKQYRIIMKDLIYEKQFLTYYNVGLLKLKQGNQKAAYEYFNKSIEENSNYCPALFQKALLTYNRGFTKQSVQMFKKSTRGTCTNLAAPHYYYGLSLMESGKKEQAKDKFEYVLEKFSSTKFGTLAQIKLSRLKSLGKDNSEETIEARVRRWNLEREKRSDAPKF